MATADSCDICGGEVRPYRHGWVFRCACCGVLSSTLEVAIPAEASEAVIDEAAREAGLATLRRRNNLRLLASLARLLPPGRRRLLDVGSGPGFLLAQARAAGFEAEGIEPDANTVEAARSHGASVRHGYFPGALADGERFDAIVFNDVLEHIPDLKGALAACTAHLAPGGVLCLNCPDQRGFFYRTADMLDRLGIGGPYERLWQRGLPSPHVWYFTPALLDRAAAAAGFQPAERTRLATLELEGLWSRIRMERDASLVMSLASYGFSLGVYPLQALLPSDATACFYRKPV
jgi:2-polyprenyl-3-methyl-5-hydroxy-6-metoxy-1,4-benzoquinol methylase